MISSSLRFLSSQGYSKHCMHQTASRTIHKSVLSICSQPDMCLVGCGWHTYKFSTHTSSSTHPSSRVTEWKGKSMHGINVLYHCAFLAVRFCYHAAGEHCFRLVAQLAFYWKPLPSPLIYPPKQVGPNPHPVPSRMYRCTCCATSYNYRVNNLPSRMVAATTLEERR